jgi:predicted metallopeptidase
MQNYIKLYDVLICVTDEGVDKEIFDSRDVTIFRAMAIPDLINPENDNIPEYGVMVWAPDFCSLSENARAFLLLHEVAHIILKAMGKRKTQTECDMDMYTLRELTREEIASALQELLNVVVADKKSSWRNYVYWECKYRIAYALGSIPKYIRVMMILTACLNLKDLWEDTKKGFAQAIIDQKVKKVVQDSLTKSLESALKF